MKYYLKECPFCGGEAELIDNCEPMRREFTVMCRCCHADVDWFPTRKAAVDRWNRRIST